MLLLPLALWLIGAGAGPRAAAPPRFDFHAGQAVCVVGYDMSAERPALWPRDLDLEQRASEQFAKEHHFRLVAAPDEADFVFVVLYDVHSREHAEAGIALRPGDYRWPETYDALRAAAIWYGLDRSHSNWKPLPFYSAARALVHSFSRQALRKH